MILKDILPFITNEYIIVSTPTYRRFTYNRSHQVPERLYEMHVKEIFGCDYYSEPCIELQIREEI